MRHENDLQVRGPSARLTDEQRLANRAQSYGIWPGLPSSQSKTTCPHCGREPGGYHKASCPRHHVNPGRERREGTI